MLAFQPFLSAFLIFLIFLSGILAAPFPDVKLNNVTTRSFQVIPEVPTLDEMKTHLKVDPDTSLFYSANKKSKGGPPDAKAWAKTKHPKYKILAQMWKDSSYPDQWQGLKDDPHGKTSKKFFDVASQAMAELSSGTVYVMMAPSTQSDGKDWYKESVWARKEWLALKDNHQVTTVIRVNPDTAAEIRIKG